MLATKTATEGPQKNRLTDHLSLRAQSLSCGFNNGLWRVLRCRLGKDTGGGQSRVHNADSFIANVWAQVRPAEKDVDKYWELNNPTHQTCSDA